MDEITAALSTALKLVEAEMPNETTYNKAEKIIQMLAQRDIYVEHISCECEVCS